MPQYRIRPNLKQVVVSSNMWQTARAGGPFLFIQALLSTTTVPTGADIAQWTSAVTGTAATVGLAGNVTFGELLMQNTTLINIGAGGGTLTATTVADQQRVADAVVARHQQPCFRQRARRRSG